MPRFDYSRDVTQINVRQLPELYQVGRGEQGVLLVEPYKSALLPHCRFHTPALAEASDQSRVVAWNGSEPGSIDSNSA